uniref:Uncharacterized protein n=1 Tax=Wuchereria bancrofti TaxID=6293 RepID=A0A1I8EET8_WUCBA
MKDRLCVVDRFCGFRLVTILCLGQTTILVPHGEDWIVSAPARCLLMVLVEGRASYRRCWSGIWANFSTTREKGTVVSDIER